MEKNHGKRREEIVKVLKKAQKDKAFRKKLLENPELALKQEGLEVPKGVHIKFFEKPKDTHYYILPAEGTELSDQELIKLAGGVVDPKGYAGCWC